MFYKVRFHWREEVPCCHSTAQTCHSPIHTRKALHYKPGGGSVPWATREQLECRESEREIKKGKRRTVETEGGRSKGRLEYVGKNRCQTIETFCNEPGAAWKPFPISSWTCVPATSSSWMPRHSPLHCPMLEHTAASSLDWHQQSLAWCSLPNWFYLYLTSSIDSIGSSKEVNGADQDRSSGELKGNEKQCLWNRDAEKQQEKKHYFKTLARMLYRKSFFLSCLNIDGKELM